MAKKSGRKILDSVRDSSLFNFSNGRKEQLGPIERNLMRVSTLGMRWDANLIKRSRAIGATERLDSMYSDNDSIWDELGSSDIVGENQYIAHGDKSYAARREFMRSFALDATIENCVEIISDETIIYDDNGYFANMNLDILKSRLKANEKSEDILNSLEECYNKVYTAFNFNESNYAWQYMKKFLIDGFLCFEIIYEKDENNNACDIIGFKELDPTTIKPVIKKLPNKSTGRTEEHKMWIQNEGIDGQENMLPDASVIYISWAKANYLSSLSYVERLIKTFNILRQLENSRVIWNVQNAQKRIKIIVPTGSNNHHRVRTRLAEIRAYYKEDVTMDTMNGEIIYNGSNKFPFAKNYIVPTKSGESIQFEEMSAEGYDLKDTNLLGYFWDRFISETKIPRSRFTNRAATAESGMGGSANYVGDQMVTREEYAFSRFLNRVRTNFNEILLKPVWELFTIENPDLAGFNTIKGFINITYNEENIFKRMKEKEVFTLASTVIESLASIMDWDGTPYFSRRFLIEKYLDLPEEMIRLNARYKIGDKKRQLNKQSEGGMDPNQQNDPFGQPDDPFSTSDFGGGMDDFDGGDFDDGLGFGPGDDFGGDLGDTGGDFDLPDTPMPDLGDGGDLGGDFDLPDLDA